MKAEHSGEFNLFQLPQKHNKSVKTSYNQIQQLYLRLNSISRNSQNYLHILKDYMTIYVENHKNNQDLFSILCQHEIVPIIFKGINTALNNLTINSHASLSLCVESLEIFNLLLANTNKELQLGYILSHSSLHEGLFNISNSSTGILAVLQNPTSDTSEFIEYYAQILKSLSMKLSASGNQSFLKLFYNNKYSNFPLMLICCYIATENKKGFDQLTKVTAKQCVLVLTRLLRKKNMIAFVSQLPILVFYGKIIQIFNQTFENHLRKQQKSRKTATNTTINYKSETIVIDRQDSRDQNSDYMGQLGYLVDLLWQIRQNFIAVIAVMNAITNLIVIPNLKRPLIVLEFLQDFFTFVKINLKKEVEIYQQEKINGGIMQAQNAHSFDESILCDQLPDIRYENVKQWCLLISRTMYTIASRFLFKNYLQSQYLGGYLSLIQGAFGGGIESMTKQNSTLSIKYMMKRFDDFCKKNNRQLEQQFKRKAKAKQVYDYISPTSTLILHFSKLENSYSNDQNFLKNKEYFFKLKTKERQNKIKRNPSVNKSNDKSTKKSQSFSLYGAFMKKISEQYILKTYFSRISRILGIKLSKLLEQSDSQNESEKKFKKLNFQSFLEGGDYTIFIGQYTRVWSQYQENKKKIINQPFSFLSKSFAKSSSFADSRTSFMSLPDVVTSNSKEEKAEPHQIHFNELRSEWELDINFLNFLLKLIFQQPIYGHRLEENYLECISEGPWSFILGFKNYLSSNIAYHLDIQGKSNQKQQIQMIKLFEKIFHVLKISLTKNSIKCLNDRLQKLNQQIHGFLFEDGFRKIAEFLINQNSLQNSSENPEPNYKIRFSVPNRSGQRVIMAPESYVIINKLSYHESLTSIIRPGTPSLIENYKRNILQFARSHTEKPKTFEITFFGKKCVLIISLSFPDIKPQILMQIFMDGQQIVYGNLLQFDLMLRINSIDRQVIHFGKDNEPIKMNSEKQSIMLMETVNRYKFLIQECITMGVIQYLQQRSSKVNFRERKGSVNQIQSSRNSFF